MGCGRLCYRYRSCCMGIFIVLRWVEHVEVTAIETAAPTDKQDDDQSDREGAKDDSNDNWDDMEATG